MLFTIFSVFYVLIAAAMIVLILLQRGSGADAGSGFGGGASATVFGARGSASFLTRATAVLAALFFVLSLAMGIYLSQAGTQKPQQDLGLMSGAAAPVPAASATVAPKPGTGVVPQNVPAPAQNNEVPQATQARPASAQTPARNSEVPKATPPPPQSSSSSGKQ